MSRHQLYTVIVCQRYSHTMYFVKIEVGHDVPRLFLSLANQTKLCTTRARANLKLVSLLHH